MKLKPRPFLILGNLQEAIFHHTKTKDAGIPTSSILGAVEQIRTAEPLPYQGSALPTELQQHTNRSIYYYIFGSLSMANLQIFTAVMKIDKKRLRTRFYAFATYKAFLPAFSNSIF